MDGWAFWVITLAIVVAVVLASLYTIYWVIRPHERPQRTAPARPWRATTKIGCLAGYLSAVLLVLFMVPWKPVHGEAPLLPIFLLLVLLGLGLVAGLIMLVVSFGQALSRRSQREEEDPE